MGRNLYSKRKFSPLLLGLLMVSIFLSGCSDDENVNTRAGGGLNGNPIGVPPVINPPIIPPVVNPVLPTPIVGPPGGIINDGFTNAISQVLNNIPCNGATQGLVGRIRMEFVSPPNGAFNRIYGPFAQNGAYPAGNVQGVFLGFNQVIGDIMIIRKIGTGTAVTAYHMELHLCQDGTLVQQGRPLGNLRLRTATPIILDNDVRCPNGIGDIDWAALVMDAAAVQPPPGFPPSGPAPVYIGIAPIGSINFCQYFN